MRLAFLAGLLTGLGLWGAHTRAVEWWMPEYAPSKWSYR
jgi:hypothetical protein